jgi:hypothetical protein
MTSAYVLYLIAHDRIAEDQRQADRSRLGNEMRRLNGRPDRSVMRVRPLGVRSRLATALGALLLPRI